MNKPRMVWGIICLVLAVLIGVLSAALPPGTITFMVEGTNQVWVPAAVLGILGIVLLVSAARHGTEAEQPVVVDEEKAALNKRLETVAWGCFLVLLGGFLFVPEAVMKGGWWPIGVGLIMLGLNAARYFSGLRMSGTTTFLGFLSVLGGVLDLAGVEGIDGAILLIVLGGYLIVRPWIEKRGLFGKAEQA